MENIARNWFECRIRYDKVTEDGTEKKVTEAYAIDAMSYAEAENRIIEEMSSYVSGELEVATITKAPYKEAFVNEEEDADRFYRVKLDFITIDEKTEKEKRSRVTYLVQAKDLKQAMKEIEDVMRGTMIDYDAASITETKIVDIFYQSKNN